MKITAVVVSCEHGGNDVPPEYQALFKQSLQVLESHRAFDYGAFEIASFLSGTYGFDFAHSRTTRLLIDCNRSLSNPYCFSEFSRALEKSERQKLTDEYYWPYRHQVERFIKAHIERGHQVLHLSIHTFTPHLNGKSRNAAIGLLYDPVRHGEKEVARLWSSLLTKHPPAYRVRLNYPYTGTSDGFTRELRKKYPEEQYLGIEVETNQAILQEVSSFRELKTLLADTLQDLLQLLWAIAIAQVPYTMPTQTVAFECR